MMQPAQRSLPYVKGNIALHQPWVEAVVSKFFLAPAARKKATFIALWLEFNLECTGQASLMKFHDAGLSKRVKGACKSWHAPVSEQSPLAPS